MALKFTGFFFSKIPVNFYQTTRRLILERGTI